MQLQGIDQSGKDVVVTLAETAVTLGRSVEADVQIEDEKVSRVHCEIRFWDGEYVVKDLKSRNGTFINDVRIDVGVLREGDTLKVGATVLETRPPKTGKGPQTVIREVGQEMAGGKGYRTLLREIVKSTDAKKPKAG